jgi:hypothetical protein
MAIASHRDEILVEMKRWLRPPRPVGTKLLWFVPLAIFRPYGTYLLVSSFFYQSAVPTGLKLMTLTLNPCKIEE